jgi:polysaccharide biosynthesis/export protein
MAVKSLLTLTSSMHHLSLTALLTALVLLLPLHSQAQVPTAQQMQYFQSLSKSEQAALAKRFGIELPDEITSTKSERLPKTIYKQGELSLPPQFQTEVKANSSTDDTRSNTENNLSIFGLDVFANQTTSFTPIGDLPPPADYIVAPGDEINIQLYGKVNEQYSLEVRRDGYINIPDLGPVSVIGKRFDQVKKELTERISKQIIGAQIAVAMGELHTMQIYVLGDANHPGAYQLSSLATAFQAIIAAGGISETGSLRNIQVRRGNQLISRIDLYQLLLHGNRSGDIRLQSGDAVFISPANNRVSIEGEVLRPAIYEFTRQDKQLSQLIDSAGGLLPSAQAERIRIERAQEDGLHVHTASPNAPGFTLQAGDRVIVARKNTQYRGDILLTGAFVNPGRRGFSPGLRVSDVLGNQDSALREEADRDIALLVRKDAAHRISVQYLLLSADKSDEQDPLLNVGDELIVLPRFIGRPTKQNNPISVNPKNAKEQKGNRQTLSNRPEDLDTNIFTDKQNMSAQNIALENAIVVSGQTRNQKEEKQSERDRLRKSLEPNLQQRAAILAPTIEKLQTQASQDELQQLIEIAGEVKYPGKYPFMQGMTLEQLLQIAGGLLESAYTIGAELTRLNSKDGRLALSADTVSLTPPDAATFKLQARDRLNVFQRPEWRNTVAIEIRGEVKFPGTYVLPRGQGLADVIKRAGGLTQFAFPEGAVLSRESLKERENKELARLRDRLREEVATLSLRRSTPVSGLSVSPSEAVAAVDQLSEVSALGRLVINLPAILADQHPNVFIEDGDYLYIPANKNTVTVIGEVQYPSSHMYEEGLSYEDYLSRAGGVRKRADKKRIYIIQANGQVALPKNSWFGAKIHEGDTIVVPIDAEYIDKLSVFGAVTQILYQLGIAYDAIRN